MNEKVLKYYEVNNCEQNGMPRRQQHALDDEQRKLCDMLIQMGMDAGVAWEAASMGLDQELAVDFCMDESVRQEQRESHRAALAAANAREGTRSGGARAAASSLGGSLNNSVRKPDALLGNGGMGKKSSMAIVRGGVERGGTLNDDSDEDDPPLSSRLAPRPQMSV